MDQLPLLGGASAVAVLAVVILYLLRANAVYRADYRADNDAWEARYAAEVAMCRVRLDAEIAAHMRTQELLDGERERRRLAEDRAWEVAKQPRLPTLGSVNDDAS